MNDPLTLALVFVGGAGGSAIRWLVGLGVGVFQPPPNWCSQKQMLAFPNISHQRSIRSKPYFAMLKKSISSRLMITLP